MSNEDFEGRGCKYRTFIKDYKISNKGTIRAKVLIDYNIETHYREKYSQWLHLVNLREELRLWRPCEYFDQLNIASASIAMENGVLNYAIFLAFLQKTKRSFLQENY